MPDVEAFLLSHPLDAVTNRPDITAVSTHSFGSVETARNQLHPLIGSRSIASFASFTAAGGHLNSSIVIRDPPRERLAGSREESHSERISSDSSVSRRLLVASATAYMSYGSMQYVLKNERFSLPVSSSRIKLQGNHK